MCHDLEEKAMRKIFHPQVIEDYIEVSRDDSKHLIQVLRYGIGDVVAVSDTTGCTYETRIHHIENGVVTLETVKVIEEAAEGMEVYLCAGLLKGDKYEWVLQKATELNVSGIYPLMMDHCVIKLKTDKWPDKAKRWEKIMEEGAKQCGRSVLPVLHSPTSLKEMKREPEDLWIVPYENEEDGSLQKALQSFTGRRIFIFIGPEGGFSKEEITHLRAEQGVEITLGKNILRAETAAITALAIVQYEKGGWQ